MSRCSVCNKRLGHYDYSMGQDTCNDCRRSIRRTLLEMDAEAFLDNYDKEHKFELEQEGVKQVPNLDYYDSLEYFDEDNEENT